MLKKLDRYLLAESLPAVLFGMLLYSVLGVVSATLPRLQWIVGAPVGEVLGWLVLQLPTTVVQTLPLALVLGVLISYGRLAADRELIALQAGAVPLWRVSLLYTGLGLSCTLLSLGINEYVLPVTHARVATQYWQLTSGSSGLFRLARQALALDEFTLHFDGVDRATDEMSGVRIERWQDRRLLVLFADAARFEDRGLRLYGYSSAELDLSALGRQHADAETAFAALVRADSRPRDASATLLLTTSDTQEELIARYDQGGFEDPVSITGARRRSLEETPGTAEQRRMQVLFQRKLAEPFGCLVLLLLALPLAERYARSRGLAFGLSLIVTLVWYLFLTVGQLLAQTGTLPVWVGVWLANIVLAGAGLVLRQRPRGRQAATGT